MEYKHLYENALILAPREYHRYFYDYRKAYPSVNFTLMSIEEAEASFRYIYDERAALYLIKNKGFSLNYAEDVLSSICNMEEGKIYKGSKLEKLYPLFEELIKVGLLTKPIHPEIPFKNRLIISAYPYGERILNLTSKTKLSNLACLIDKSFLKVRETLPKVYNFPNLYMEVHYLMNAIADLIASGEDPENIYIGNYSSEYHLTLELLSKAYGFTIAFPSETNLYSSKQAKSFFSIYESTNPIGKENIEGIDIALSSLKSSYEDDFTTQKVIEIIEKYRDDELPYSLQKEVLKSALEKQLIPSPSLKGAVQILQSNFPPKNSHIFLIDFNLSNSPRIHKDNLFLSDEERKQLGLLTSSQKNSQEEVELEALIKSSNLKAITHKDSFIDGDYFPSPLVSKSKEEKEDSTQQGGLKLESEESPIYPKEYCKEFARICASSIHYEAKRFGNEDPRYPIYKKVTNYDENSKGYDYSFTGVNIPSLKDKEITLSYSQVDQFNKCHFAYYLDKILGLSNQGEANFPLIYGDIFHDLINHDYLSPDYDFDLHFEEAYQNAISSNRALNNEEIYFLPNVKQTFAKAVMAIKEKEKDLGAYIETEQEPVNKRIKLDEGIYLTGKIDKMLFTKKNDTTYLTIIDYKTGGYSFDLDLIEHGFALQLPIYALIAENMKETGQISYDYILGLFISQTYPHSSKDRAGGIEKAVRKSIRLKGYYLDDPDALYSISPSMVDELTYLAKPPFTKKNGYQPDKEKCLSKEKMLEQAKIAKEQVILAANNIKSCQFKIDPRDVKGKLPCTYCEFWEICHRPDYLKARSAIDDEEIDEEENQDE